MPGVEAFNGQPVPRVLLWTFSGPVGASALPDFSWKVRRMACGLMCFFKSIAWS
jgi:hypothetical protein